MSPLYAPALKVATDTIWDTKGDVAIATGGDAAVVLPVGTSLTDRLMADSAAASGLKWAPHIVRRSADSATIASNTTLANDDTLLWPIAASEVWFVQAWLRMYGANATMDAKFGWSVPASCTASWGAHSTSSTSMAAYGPMAVAGSAAAGLLNAAGVLSVGTATVTIGVGLAGVFTNAATPGNVNLQWAQNTSDAGTLQLMKDSILLLWRLA